MQTLVRHPRVGDPVLVYEQDRGTIVRLAVGYATLDAPDDIRVQVPVDMLRWVADRGVWVILRPEPAEPVWLCDDPDFRDAAPGEVTEAFGS